jgi:hypothetical protein
MTHILCSRLRARRGEWQFRYLSRTANRVQEPGMFPSEAEPDQDSVAVNLHRQRAQGPLIARTVLRVPGSLTSSSSTNNSNNINSSSNSNNQRAAVRPVYSATWRISARTSQLWECSISTNRQLTCALPTSLFKAGLGNELSEAAERRLPILW